MGVHIVLWYVMAMKMDVKVFLQHNGNIAGLLAVAKVELNCFMQTRGTLLDADAQRDLRFVQRVIADAITKNDELFKAHITSITASLGVTAEV